MSDDFVEVTTRQLALKSPNFLVQHEGKIYYTVAVLEYDPKAKGRSTRQVSDSKKVFKIFESSKKKESAVVITDIQEWKHQSTQPGIARPPRPKAEFVGTAIKEAKIKGTKVTGTKR